MLTDKEIDINWENLENESIRRAYIERKIDNLERRIETEKLDITEENAIIDKIREYADRWYARWSDLCEMPFRPEKNK